MSISERRAIERQEEFIRFLRDNPYATIIEMKGFLGTRSTSYVQHLINRLEEEAGKVSRIMVGKKTMGYEIIESVKPARKIEVPKPVIESVLVVNFEEDPPVFDVPVLKKKNPRSGKISERDLGGILSGM